MDNERHPEDYRRALSIDLCLKRTGVKPDLENPKTYNDWIAWLKVNDKSGDHVICVDKVSARSRVPERHRIPLISVSGSPVDPKGYPYVMKCSHDSGSAAIIRGKRDFIRHSEVIKRQMNKTYGLDKGEWAYAYVPKRVICEELLSDSTDYKFHITNGVIRWVQVIWDRPNTKEAIFTVDGYDWVPSSLHMDEKMKKAQREPPNETARRDLMDLAVSLSQGFKYVRVDLYYTDRPYFGEFTFWPRSGCYKSKDQAKFGEMLCLSL